ncbi:cytochrome P450 3A13 isoform X1 [Patella vulgata]|uniref:cytochrome P450 3A13 isoform X1 n=2 Tax=Patella vulgata TaxID=6465 RepID=UPI00217FC007|nr:cytochrome P450 3A13 isoform X1 [Patella vulgata]
MACFGCETLLWIVAIVILLAAAFYFYITWTHSIFKNAGIPGPEPGLLGVVPMYRNNTMGDIDIELHKKYGKILGYFNARLPVLSVADPDTIKDICIKHFSHFVDRPTILPMDKYEKGFLTLVRGAKWKSSRSILTPTFSSGKLREMMPLMQTCTENLLKHLEQHADSGKSVDVTTFIKGYSLDVICSVAFGIDVDSQNEPDNPVIKACIKAMKLEMTDPYTILCATFPFMARVFESVGIGFMASDCKSVFTKLIDDIIKERKENPSKRKDFLQLLINANEETKDNKDGLAFTYYDIWSGAVVFLLAGYDTSSTALTFALYNLATHPEVQERVVEEINTNFAKDEAADHDNVGKLTYLQMVVDETLRMYPPLTKTSRAVTEEMELNGYKITKEMEIFLPIYAIHRDPDYWENPDRFDPERFSPEQKTSRHPYCYLPFGVGPRNCIGNRLALMEIKTVLVSILRKYRVICSPETETPTIQLTPGDFMCRPKNGVFVKLEERNG